MSSSKLSDPRRLFKDGLIAQDEFDAKRKVILNATSSEQRQNERHRVTESIPRGIA